jgi:general secretion pathway protein B
MSFILDALRKSETERQRQSGPGLADAGYRPPVQRRAIWIPVIVIALLANLLVMSWFWLRGEPAAPPPAAVTAPAPVTPEPLAADPVGRSLAAAAGVSTPPVGDYGATADLPAIEPEPVTEALEPPPVTDEPVVGAAGFVRDDLPSAEQAVASGAIPSQDLHLDIHVYSTVPAERFVFINMRKYGEGAQLPQGAVIEKITQDGVVLSQGGQQFALTRD